jgi:hypothetical protein
MLMNKDKEVSLFPFHAINEFMTDEYRESVIRSVLLAHDTLPEDYRNNIDRFIKKSVTIPGFRNSAKAPAQLRVKPTIDSFQKNPALVAAILAAWAELHAALRQEVYDLLIGRGWELLPVEADRTKLPGFLTKWPKGEDFETLYQAYTATYTATAPEMNDVSLMEVWLSGRLPYEIEDKEETVSEQSTESPGTTRGTN